MEVKGNFEESGANSAYVQPPTSLHKQRSLIIIIIIQSLEFSCTGRFQEMCMYSLSELRFKVDWTLLPLSST